MSDIPRKTTKLCEACMQGFLPPDDITVSQWAEKKRRLSAESSAEPGAWRNSRTPYLIEPMDAFTDPKVHHIVIWAASQVGKSEAELNIIGYIIDEDPGSILYIHPTNVDAKEFSKLRIAPMVRDCPTLRDKVADPKQRDSANTVMQKTYPGGILTLCGSTEAHALASKPIRYVLGDERDRWALSAGTEGDPWELAMARQTTFYNAKSVEVSTPTIKGASAIEAAYALGTMEVWQSQCPNCGEYQEIKWANIRFEYDTVTVAGKKTYKVNSITYICPECGSVLTEYEMKKAPARWHATNPSAYDNGCRSFKLNAFVSQWMPWGKIIQKYLQAQGDTRKLQVVYNTCFGELWEDRGNLQDEDSYLARREDYGRNEDGSMVELPEGVLVLTCGVDTQDDRLEYEVKGFGHFSENWGIERGVIIGRPDSEEVWEKLDGVIDRVYHFKDGKGLKISLTFVDEGGHFTQEVRRQCQIRIGKSVFAIKGVAGIDKPYTSPPKKMQIKIGNGHTGTCWQYQIGVDAGKQQIMDNLKVQTPGARYCHFPKKDEYGVKYFNGLLSEHLVYNVAKKQPWQWVKIPGHERNETLDINNYALAAFKSLNANMDALDLRLKELRGQRVKTPATTPKPKVQPPTRHKRHESFFDPW